MKEFCEEFVKFFYFFENQKKNKKGFGVFPAGEESAVMKNCIGIIYILGGKKN